jgi:beta-lactamase regulating signal transducer with metallopeptidase domain
MNLLLASFIDAAVVLSIGLAATLVLRGRSAALRHAVLALAIGCACLMPVFEVLLPSVPVAQWQKQTVLMSTTPGRSSGLTFADTTSTISAPNWPDAVSWPTAFAAVWAVLSVVVLAGLVTGLSRLARLRARCTPVTGRWRELTDELAVECGVRRSVSLLQSDDPSLLVTYGWLRPGIILPAEAANWSDDRRRVVLRHELAHVSRHDAAIQLAGEILRVLQPVNPFVWIACRRLRQESEYATDDVVLAGGVGATEYATHLLDVARSSGRQASWVSAPAIAHPSTLERRIVAMLQSRTVRHPLNRRGWFVAALVAFGVSLPLAAAGVAPVLPSVVAPTVAFENATGLRTIPEPVAASAPVAVRTAPVNVGRRQASLSGHVMDQTGARIPGANVTITDQKTQVTFAAVTNASGAFVFSDVPAGTYNVTAELPGFKKAVRVGVELTAGASINQPITLEVGALSETISVQCAPSPASVSASLLQFFFPVVSAQSNLPIRVGGQIRPPKKLKDARPVCPSSMSSGTVVVIFEARIGVDGLVKDLRAIRNGPAELIASATDAIRQWEFSPTLLNGQPVEVVMTVSVSFTGPAAP